MPDPREPLGRIVHEERLACEAERAAAEGRQRFRLGEWEERPDGQRELDMRIGHAVANYALTENAASWGTSCVSCARILDSAYAETVRREAAEALLAEVRETAVTFLAVRGGGQGAADAVAAVLQVLDRVPLGGEAQERSGEKEAGRG